MLKDVTVDVRVTDGTSGPAGFTLEAVTSSEPDAPLTGDIQGWQTGTPDTAGKLRAERNGRKDRVYTLRYRGRDAAGNTTGCVEEVRVAR